MSAGVLEVRLSGRLSALTLEVEFAAPAGAVTALTGPSAGGKTTVLRALAGLERLGGEVRVGGETWQDGRIFMPPHRRAVGLVFQNAALLPHLSVRRNLEYGARRAGAGVAAVDEAVALLGLAPLLRRMPDRLSGGERQRVALGRALATRPRLLMLDEPLSGLDPAAKAELLPELKRVFAALSPPVLYVSHDPAEVAAVADRVLRLGAGRLAPDPQPGADALNDFSPEQVAALARAALRAGLRP